MTQVNDEEQVISDPLCHCGSPVTIRRRTFESWQGGSLHFEACCTDRPGQHTVPDSIAAEVDDLNDGQGKG